MGWGVWGGEGGRVGVQYKGLILKGMGHNVGRNLTQSEGSLGRDNWHLLD